MIGLTRFTKDEINKRFFSSKWNTSDQFIFENNLLIGIVYNWSEQPYAPRCFCVYDTPRSGYDGLFKNKKPGTNNPVLVFRLLEDNQRTVREEIEFEGLFDVERIGWADPQICNCPPQLGSYKLVGLIS